MRKVLSWMRHFSIAAGLVITISACSSGSGFDVTAPSAGGGSTAGDCQTQFDPSLVGVAGQDCTPLYHKFCPDAVIGTSTANDTAVVACDGVTITTGSATADGVTIPYVVVKPSGSGAGGNALIVALHWAAANGPTMANVMRMAELAKGRNVTVVLPTAPSGNPLSSSGTWGKSGSEIPVALATRIDLIDMVVSQVRSSTATSGSPLLVSGVSGGGIMSFYYACARPAVSGIETVVGEITQGDLDACTRTAPLAAVAVIGTADYVSTLAGSAPTATLFTKLQSFNGCTGTPKTAHLNPLAGEAVTGIDISYITSCTGGKGSSTVVVQNGGHNWPGEDRNFDTSGYNIYGATTNAFDATLQGYDLLRYLGG